MATPDATAPEPPSVEAPGAASRPGARRWRWAAGIVAVLIGLVVGAAVVVVRAEPPPVEADVASGPAAPAEAEFHGAWPTTTVTTTTTPPTTTPPTTTTADPAPPRAEDGLMLASPLPRPWAEEFLVADAVVPRVALHSAPGVAVPSGRALDHPTFEDLDLVFLVRDREPGWLLAQIMSRPNSAMAWIKESDVTLRTVPHHIVVEREARRMTVYAGERAIFQTAVATGRASSPTPLGPFFVDGLVPLSPPHPAYGTGQVSFSGYSEVHETFGGGVGQVALHGTQSPGLIGTPASNGCVRLTNDDIETVMALAPTGTPVQVLA